MPSWAITKKDADVLTSAVFWEMQPPQSSMLVLKEPLQRQSSATCSDSVSLNCPHSWRMEVYCYCQRTVFDAGQEEVCAPCTIPRLTRTTSLKTEHDDKHWVGKSDSKPAVRSDESDASVESDWAETSSAVAARGGQPSRERSTLLVKLRTKYGDSPEQLHGSSGEVDVREQERVVEKSARSSRCLHARQARARSLCVDRDPAGRNPMPSQSHSVSWHVAPVRARSAGVFFVCYMQHIDSTDMCKSRAVFHFFPQSQNASPQPARR